MSAKNTYSISRRRFIGQALFAAAAPTIIPRTALSSPGRPGANDRIHVGFIGQGNRARDLIQIWPKESTIAAVCDCWLRRAQEMTDRCRARWNVYQNYHEMFEKENLDGVIVATKVHHRVMPCIHACQAGLDVFAEKPIALSIRESRVLTKVVEKHGRVYQADTQQRTISINKYVCEFIRAGGIGKIKEVTACNYEGPVEFPGPFPQDPQPKDLDWDMWCNSTPLYPYARRLHLSYQPNWRQYGQNHIGNVGAHGLDMIQFALGMDNSGPVEVWPIPDAPCPDGNVALRPMAMRYANGVVVRMVRKSEGSAWSGAIFLGEKAKVEIKRNGLASNPSGFLADAPPPDKDGIGRAKDSTIPRAIVTVPHIRNWLECMRSRRRPNAHEEIAHRTNTVVILIDIARQLNRKVRWDPESETFPGDDEANALIDRPRRKGWELPEV